MHTGKEASIIKTDGDELFLRFLESANRSETAKTLKVAIDRFFGQLTGEEQLGLIEYVQAKHRSKGL